MEAAVLRHGGTDDTTGSVAVCDGGRTYLDKDPRDRGPSTTEGRTRAPLRGVSKNAKGAATPTGRSTMLEDDDERALFAVYAATRDPAVRAALVARFLPLARHVALRFSNRGEPIEDLVQVAAYAMVKAMDRFEPDRGIRFVSFAVPTMAGEIKRYFRDRVWAAKVPRRVKELRVAMRAVLIDLTQSLGRSPTVREVADRLHVREDAVLEVIEAGGAYQARSLTVLVGEDVDDPLEYEPPVLAVDDAAEGLVDDHQALKDLLTVLTPRERVIVYLRFFDGLTQSEIAQRVGMSQMHVSRLLQRSLHALREAAVNRGLDEAFIAGSA